MNLPGSTIAAIATATGPGAIAIVRVSGPDTYAIADRVFRPSRSRPVSERKAGGFVHGRVVHPVAGKEETIDECLVLLFRSPRSYTGEDLIEIQCHGGPVISALILKAVLGAGASPAMPGEFTRRAFLNGRLDLLQAEAVADLISASSERSARSAQTQISGQYSHSIESIYDFLISTVCELEVLLDFDEGEDLHPDWRKVMERIDSCIDSISELCRGCDHGHLLRDGVRTVLVGPPNSGKSTLMNALLGRDRSIVSIHPGTTRDTIEESLLIDGVLFTLVDTAGIRDSACPIEKEGIARARMAVSAADLWILVLDHNCEEPVDKLAAEYGIHTDRTIVVLNKSDLGPVERSAGGFRSLQCSAMVGSGIDVLRRMMLEACGMNVPAPSVALSSRHADALRRSLGYLKVARSDMESQQADMLVPCAASMRSAVSCLDEILGRHCSEEVLDAVFSRFCIGK